MNNDIKNILLSVEDLKNSVKRLGAEISRDFKDKNPIIICILKGSVIFSADLIRAIDIPVEIDFMALSSYGSSTVSSGVVKIKKDIDADVTNRDIIIVEDIIDSGLTLKYINEYFQQHNPASVSICALLDKPEAHKTDLNISYLGFEIGNDFVVGYGLDFNQKYRNLPYIGILKEEIYS